MFGNTRRVYRDGMQCTFSECCWQMHGHGEFSSADGTLYTGEFNSDEAPLRESGQALVTFVSTLRAEESGRACGVLSVKLL